MLSLIRVQNDTPHIGGVVFKIYSIPNIITKEEVVGYNDVTTPLAAESSYLALAEFGSWVAKEGSMVSSSC